MIRYILVAVLATTGCAARAVGPPKAPPSASVTTKEALELDAAITRLRTEISILRNTHAILQADHYTICFNRNRGELSIIRPRRGPPIGARTDEEPKYERGMWRPETPDGWQDNRHQMCYVPEHRDCRAFAGGESVR